MRTPQKVSLRQGRGLTTSDNKKVDGNLISSVKMILGGCSESRLRKLGMEDFFDSLAKNFIKANTEEDIKQFVTHNIAMKMVDILVR